MCSSIEYNIERIDKELVQIRCMACDSIWVINNPYDEEEKPESKKSGDFWIVRIYDMMFPVVTRQDVETIFEKAISLGYPASSMRAFPSQIVASALVCDELDWIAKQEQEHLTPHGFPILDPDYLE